MARNLNVAVQPAVADARWPTSKMDFLSNEAGRTVPQELNRHCYAEPISKRSHSISVESHQSWPQELRRAP
jgi:hypothetical protein